SESVDEPAEWRDWIRRENVKVELRGGLVRAPVLGPTYLNFNCIRRLNSPIRANRNADVDPIRRNAPVITERVWQRLKQIVICVDTPDLQLGLKQAPAGIFGRLARGCVNKRYC